MKRDWDIIRELLIQIESLENPDEGLSLDGFDCPDEKTAAVISYHMDLLIQRGFVKGSLLSTTFGSSVDSPTDFLVHSLTWSGHEFLDAIRSDTIWNKTKEILASKSVDLSFEAIKAVAPMAMNLVLGATGFS
ncbi:DUF2513 domain-containing protein [Aeromonas veronii]|uniref:DUF2513 domain-containing protein n=1 Tax=Aeromonas veronii TaxID=654 RepID=A0AAX2USX4_AERVE|nr:DUF2513 domain-containing protein [Aeromonas veronii]TND53674.1 hypothetical protein CF123_11995 [Aeromonas veronii]